MDGIGAAVVAAAAFVWFGMVLAISFLEAPLKFRAPGVTRQVGVGIGRIVFTALNITETVLLLVIVSVPVWGRPGAPVALIVAVTLLLVVQLSTVRPALSRRANRLLAGEERPATRAHLVYVCMEVVKVVLLVALGSTALAALVIGTTG